MFPILQIFLLISTTILFHIGITNPNHSHTSDYVAYEGITLTFLTTTGPKLGQLMTWICTLYEVLYLYLQTFSPSFISTVFPQISALINPLPLTPISIVGYIFMIVGGLGRIWCYKTLGVFFTFELTIRNSHKLIKTGPYAYVRHPSYTFAAILMIGMLLVHQRLANFFPNKERVQYIFSPAGILTICILVAMVLKGRVTREEEELKKTFGKEWIQYASETKKFIPRLI